MNIGSLAEKGPNETATEDLICNVYDMASNCSEWSTETHSITNGPGVKRGGCCSSISGDFTYTDDRSGILITSADSRIVFRPLLYL